MKGESAGLGANIQLFFSLTVGGIVLGLIFGILSTIWIKKIFNDEVLVVNITFLTCYLVNLMKCIFLNFLSYFMSLRILILDLKFLEFSR